MMVAFLNPQSIVNVRIYVEGPSSRMHFSYYADAAPKAGPGGSAVLSTSRLTAKRILHYRAVRKPICNGLCLGRHVARKQARGDRTPCGQTPRRPRYPKLAPQTRM